MKYGVGRVANLPCGNKQVAEHFIFTAGTESPDVIRVFQILYEKAATLGIVFDPLKKFGST